MGFSKREGKIKEIKGKIASIAAFTEVPWNYHFGKLKH